jgi:hypothetical protein
LFQQGHCAQTRLRRQKKTGARKERPFQFYAIANTRYGRRYAIQEPPAEFLGKGTQYKKTGGSLHTQQRNHYATDATKRDTPQDATDAELDATGRNAD